jgi:hypothetical protein
MSKNVLRQAVTFILKTSAMFEINIAPSSNILKFPNSTV